MNKDSKKVFDNVRNSRVTTSAGGVGFKNFFKNAKDFVKNLLLLT